MVWVDERTMEVTTETHRANGFAYLTVQVYGTDGCVAGAVLTPQDAREIAAELLRLADAHDAKAGAK
jgi:hypothetical protein